MKRFSVIAITIVFMLTLVSVLPSGAEDLNQIQQAIAKKGANWIAAETSISALPAAERKKLLGLTKLPSPEELPEVPVQREGVMDFDPVLDWRDKGGFDWTTPVRSQGGCGSCWAFGALAAFESLVKIRDNVPTLPIDLAEQYLLSCSAGSCSGWTMGGTSNFLKNDGTVNEECFPYMADDTIPCSAHCSDWERRIMKIGDWGWLPADDDTLKARLEDGPIYVGMAVYGDFYGYSSGVYEHVSGSLEGYHAICMVGWDDTTVPPSWICKNSWGTGWGEAGWFHIKNGNDECDIESGNIYIIPRNEGWIYGSVTEQGTGTPLDKARVKGRRRLKRFKVKTDSSGYYETTHNKKAATWRVKANKSGYNRAKYKVEVTAGSGTEVHFELEKQ